MASTDLHSKEETVLQRVIEIYVDSPSHIKHLFRNSFNLYFVSMWLIPPSSINTLPEILMGEEGFEFSVGKELSSLDNWPCLFYLCFWPTNQTLLHSSWGSERMIQLNESAILLERHSNSLFHWLLSHWCHDLIITIIQLYHTNSPNIASIHLDPQPFFF